MNGLGQLYNSSSTMPANPPYITFEKRAIERRKLAEEGGGVYYVDVDFALVTSHGSKDTVEKIAVEWFDYLKDQARQGRFPPQWLDAFKASYKAWKEDQEPPVIGTAISNWPAISPAEAKHCKALGIRAVEDLATANEELLARLGMGGRSLSARAKDWITSKNGTAPLIMQLDASRQVQLGQEEKIRQLTESVKALEMQLTQRLQAAPQQYIPSPEDRLPDHREVERNEDAVLDEVLSE